MENMEQRTTSQMPEKRFWKLISEEPALITSLNPEDPADAARALWTLYERWQAGRLPVPKGEVVSEFDLDKNAGRLSEALRRLAERTRDGAG